MKTHVWADLSPRERQAALSRPAAGRQDLETQVRAIIDTVRQGGDEALRSYARQFDKAVLDDIAVAPDDIAQAGRRLSLEARAAIDTAFGTIRAFHEQQGYRPYEIETIAGVTCRRAVRPIERVGLYVPGGSAPLVSTALMLGVPSLLAGCPVRILCTPSDETGSVHPGILYAAHLCGIETVFRVGGAQAIAAMAYGTATIPKIDKIFGPGSARVTLAKAIVAQDAAGAALDMPAGPSEVCVIATGDTDPVFAAADLLAQAEHDPQAHVVLIALSAQKAADILEETKAQLSSLPRKAIAAAALEHSVALVARDRAEALAIANAYAAEHLILCFDNAEDWLPEIINAGSVFLGPWTPESAGDYASGTNHVLPTYGYARAYAGLSVEHFQRSMTVQSLSRDGLRAIGPAVTTLARLEGLEAHARAVTLRLEKES